MKRIFVVFVWMLAMGAVAQEPIELITYNIRMNTPDDGEHAWRYRRGNVTSLFRFHRADIFCVQEALPEQMDNLDMAFPDFGYEGVGRDDGEREGEFSAVFYNIGRFEKLDGGTFWLSETPEQCSFGWDAVCRRICSWVKLKEEPSGHVLYVFNTHFDHRGKVARKESASLILKKIETITEGKGSIVLCGDFNLDPSSAPIELIREKLRDSFEITFLPPYGSIATSHGFTYDDQPRKRIDYVFVSKGIKVLRYGGLTDSKNRAFFSDHLPVLVTLDLRQ